jgi:hypothetical protein
MNNPETAAPYIRYRVARIQNFSFGNTGNDAVKMNRLAGIFIRYGRRNIFYRLAAIGAVRNRQGLGGCLRG